MIFHVFLIKIQFESQLMVTHLPKHKPIYVYFAYPRFNFYVKMKLIWPTVQWLCLLLSLTVTNAILRTEMLMQIAKFHVHKKKMTYSTESSKLVVTVNCSTLLIILNYAAGQRAENSFSKPSFSQHKCDGSLCLHAKVLILRGSVHIFHRCWKKHVHNGFHLYFINGANIWAWWKKSAEELRFEADFV